MPLGTKQYRLICTFEIGSFYYELLLRLKGEGFELRMSVGPTCPFTSPNS